MVTKATPALIEPSDREVRRERLAKAPSAALGIALSSLLLCIALCGTASAGDREVAKRMHDRLTGVPPSETVLRDMELLIGADNALGAADLAMEHPAFYNTTLKDFVTPWTNEEQTLHADLNDYTATVIGMIRDGVRFDEVLSGDLIYTGAPGVVPTNYSHNDNVHYEELQSDRIDLSDPALLVARTQSGLPGSQLTLSDAAGVLTTRAAGEAFLQAGTNRRMIRFMAVNYLCRDLEALKDVSRPADRVSQDVTRSPGGDSAIFHNQCVGCHAGMDPMRQAFAYFEFDQESGRVIHTPGQVQAKYLINANTFPGGYIVENNAWDNFWREGDNAYLDWRGSSASGYGPKSLGAEFAASRAFSICQVEKVFRKLCFRNASDEDERLEIERIATVFETETYDMKRVFAEVAAVCSAE